ncbi:hypothetical protein, partial [Plasmodium yoelii yoelii]
FFLVEKSLKSKYILHAVFPFLVVCIFFLCFLLQFPKMPRKNIYIYDKSYIMGKNVSITFTKKHTNFSFALIFKNMY